MRARTITVVASELLGRPGTGGAGTADSLLAVALARQDHRVELLVASGREVGELSPEWASNYAAAGVEVRMLHRRPGVTPPYLTAAFEVFDALRDQPPEVVIVDDWRGLGYVAMRARQVGLALTEAAFVVHCHGPARVLAEFAQKVPDTLGRFGEEVMERASVELADAVVSPSTWLLDWMRTQGWPVPPSAEVIQYVRESAALQHTPAQAAAVTAAHRLAFFGQLREGKGIRIYLSALEMLEPELVAGLELVFLGKDTPRWTHERIVASLSHTVRERVAALRVETKLERSSALAELLQPGTIAVMPSLLDNSPNTVAECIERGIPFLSTWTGGIPELVAEEDRARVLCRPTGDDLAAALRRALKSRPGFAPARPAREPGESLEAWRKLVDAVEPSTRHGSGPATRVALVATGAQSVARAQRLATRTRSVEVEIVPAFSRAAGLARSTGDRVLFLDEPQPRSAVAKQGLVERTLSVLRTEGVAGLGRRTRGRILNIFSSVRGRRPPTLPSPLESRILRLRDRRPPLHVLHLGKTGGTALKHTLLDYLDVCHYRLLLHGHDVRLGDLPVGEKFMFIVRDPISRFSSAFNGRLREDRPRYHYPWREEERIAFEVFKTPDQLATALSSDNEAEQREAEQAMRGIGHVNTSYWSSFGDEAALRARLPDLFFIGFQERLDDDFELLKPKLGLPPEVRLPADETVAHRTPPGFETQLSVAARSNLERWYERDLAFVEVCRKLASLVNNSWTSARPVQGQTDDARGLTERTQTVECEVVRAHSRQAGLARTTCDWIVFLDDEDEPDDAMLDALVAAQAASDADVVTAAVRPADDSNGLRLFLGNPGALGLVENQYGVLGLIRRALLDGSATPEGEVDPDWPLFAQLALQGARIVSVPDGLSVHRGRIGKVGDVPGEGLAVLAAFEEAQATLADLPQLAATLAAAQMRIQTPQVTVARPGRDLLARGLRVLRPEGVFGLARRARVRLGNSRLGSV